MSIYVNEPEKPAKACMIWMHGLGADASDMMGLADQLILNDIPIRHVFLDAPMRAVTLNGGVVMRAWYDIVGMELVDRVDEKGIAASEAIIRDTLQQQLEYGFDLTQIYLAGFSQGGAMALHTALHIDGQLGGVIALSAYLPLAHSSKSHLAKQTPIFMGGGQFDPLVLPVWTKQSKEWLIAKGYQEISFHQYPMEHSICYEEIKDLSLWLAKHVQGVLQ